jgi:hypothetical protein
MDDPVRITVLVTGPTNGQALMAINRVADALRLQGMTSIRTQYAVENPSQIEAEDFNYQDAAVLLILGSPRADAISK